MDHDATHPVLTNRVRYRCCCGEDLQLDPAKGGKCPKCEKLISPKILGTDLAMSMTLQPDESQLQQTSPLALNHLSDSVVFKNMSGSEEAAPDVLIGKMFGHFEIMSTLGRGGMGQVYQALDTSLQRYVAVKILKSGIGSSIEDSIATRSSDQEIEKLLQEAVSQARVTHPNIVTIYYVGKQDNDPFLAMELVQGQPLSKMIVEEAMPFEQMASIAWQIADALKFSHELDIIHGDIKPSNVLVQHNGTAKLSDFGMARRASGDDDGSIGGTPNYIAPELLRGEKPSIQSDIYALGVTLYEMSFGKLPVTLSGRTIPEWLDVHEKSDLVFPTPWPEHLPEGWKNLMGKMLAKDPDDRHHDYEELIDELQQLRGSRVIAKVFPRVVAAAIDFTTVLLLTALLQLPLALVSISELLKSHPVLDFFVHLIDLAPIIAYTVLIASWKQTLGRLLMQIRVVNQHGVEPSRNRMVLRSVFRMQFIWVLYFCMVLQKIDFAWIDFAIIASLAISAILLALDVLFAVFYNQSRSIHDIACDTRVVLDTTV